MFQVFHLSFFCMLQVLHLDVSKLDLDVAFVCTTWGTSGMGHDKYGHGDERGMAGGGGTVGDGSTARTGHRE
jgi:hypothetical protein